MSQLKPVSDTNHILACVIVITGVYISVERIDGMFLVDFVFRTDGISCLLMCEVGKRVVQLTRCKRGKSAFTYVVFRLETGAQHMLALGLDNLIRLCRAVIAVIFSYTLLRTISILVTLPQREGKTVPPVASGQ